MHIQCSIPRNKVNPDLFMEREGILLLHQQLLIYLLQMARQIQHVFKMGRGCIVGILYASRLGGEMLVESHFYPLPKGMLERNSVKGLELHLSIILSAE